ncbi:TonB-dependent receptor [uncultured Chitinophaga sp.]|uniref:TonB-dependent receptor n=1 Tax=uncultured Chitinophaga sp. TaxID=339340 RepID=UPI0025ED272D|nr:TonB-dependent receptor [uncultured Chitinophaga sp.]
MRWTAVIMLAACLSVSAKGVSQQVSLSVVNAPLNSVFFEIQKQTGLFFLCEDELLEKTPLVTLNVRKGELGEVLERCFAGTPITWSLVEKTIVIKRKPLPVAVQRADSTIVVTGFVANQKGEVLIGSTVKQKGTMNGVTANEKGNFILKVPQNSTIVITSIGYLPQEIVVGGTRNFNVVLLEDKKALDEVVVVAYGQKQRKIATLGAQSSLSVSELKQPVANITTVLAGRISGIVGVQRSAEPGLDGADLWIRGIATLNSDASKPMIMVDGVERSFNNLDPNDIETFTILKDASSTSVYGVKGANGVILITTKRGRAGKTDINIDYYQGLTTFTRVPQVTDGVTYLQMANEASVTRGGTPIYSEEAIRKTMTQEDPYLHPNVNWMDELFNQFGHNRKANLNIRGGSDKAQFYVSTSFYDEKGLFKTDNLQKYDSKIAFTRYNFASSLNIKATRTTNIDLNIKGFISNGNYPGTGTSEIFREAFDTYPTIYPKMYPDNKEPFTSTGGGLNSPWALLTNRGYVNTYGNQINSDISVRQDLSPWLKGLNARILYSFDAANENRMARLKSPYSYYARSRDANGDLILERTDNNGGSDYLSFERTSGGSRQFYFEGALSYDNTFGLHNVGAMVLFNQNDRVSATAGDLIGSLPYRSLGMVARATYSYNDRYLAEVSFGYNGAENFAPDKRFGAFPSMAVGWVISNEKLFEPLIPYVQLLKLRASYGIVGNSNLIGGRRFAYIGTTKTVTGYNYGQDRGGGIGGIEIQDYAASVTWETSKDLNLGLEFKTLNNALLIQLDYFERKRTNIFLSRAAVPATTGLQSNLLGNLGAANSSGLDASAEYNKQWAKFGLSVRGTLTYNRNKVIENDDPIQPYSWLEKRGQPIGQRFGYIAEGYYTQAEIDDKNVARTTGVVQAGDIKFRDMNGDKVIDDNDRVPIGRHSVPKLIYGFGTTLSYKGFSLGAFWQGAGLVDFYLGDSEFMPFKNGAAKGTPYANIKDRWTVDNPRQDAFYPRLAYGSGLNYNYGAENSHWIMKGDFLRLKTLDFGYTLPPGTLSKLAVQRMRIYFIGYNLLTFSPFKMYDPEMGNGAGLNYPNIKTYSLGFNVTF